MSVESVDAAPPDTRIWRMSGLVALALIGVGALSVWLFWDGLSYMWAYWVETPEYSHSMLIPIISAFLVWQQRDRLERIPFDGSAWGVLVLLLGGILLLLGELSTTYSLIECAYLVVLTG